MTLGRIVNRFQKLEGFCPEHRLNTEFRYVNTSGKNSSIYQCQYPHCQAILTEEVIRKYNKEVQDDLERDNVPCTD